MQKYNNKNAIELLKRMYVAFNRHFRSIAFIYLLIFFGQKNHQKSTGK